MNLNLIKTIENRFIKKNMIEDIKIGNYLTIHSILSKKLKRKQTFSGIVISIKKKRLYSTLTLRNIIAKICIDRTYNLNSNMIINKEIINNDLSFKRSKIYYLIPKKTIV